MPQAGIHAMVGMAARKWTPARPWLMLGIVLGNMLPDTDNIAVAIATVAKLPTEGLHRTFTHSLFTVIGVIAVFALIGGLARKPRWSNLGTGLGIGILMHILLDLVLWFNGVEILWPLPSWVNFWGGVTPPLWLDRFLMTAEFLCFALYFVLLRSTARRRGTDGDYLGRLGMWVWLQSILFVVFTILVYTLQKGFMTPFGALYLISLGLAIGVTIRVRNTVESI